jgi:protein-S-isoprenylcysteine O-methyltransferase Ste14
MNEQALFNLLLFALFFFAMVTATVLFFVTAPYGRHIRKGWGPTLDNRLGWIVMEAPAPLVFALCFLVSEYRGSPTAWVFLLMWEVHYVYRAFIYPLQLRGSGKRMPVIVAAIGFLFNALNGYLNGRYLYSFSGGYPNDWLIDPRFVAGLLFFVTGYAINRQSDRTLHRLRGNGEPGYAIPYGGFYRWVSSPNYFGEIIQWFGWALATWSLVGLMFAVWTAANLAPRAFSHHRWYREYFVDYPPERKALLPRLW